MENSRRQQSSASLDTQDPFRDPAPSVGSTYSVHDSFSDHSTEIPTHPPAEFRPAHVRDPFASSPRHQQQPRYASARSRSASDEILPIPPIGHSTGEDIFYDFPQSEKLELQYPQDVDYSSTDSDLSTRRAIPEPLDRTPRKIKVGKRMICITKWIFVALLLSANTMFIFSTWWWERYYYVFLPFITITVALNCVMVASVTFNTLRHKLIPEKEEFPDTPETMVLLLPCYNETSEELVKSLDSLVGQVNIDQHKKAIIIVCDGQVRGPGMAKTTAAYLLDDILTGPSSREYISAAYTSWDHTQMDVVVQSGTYGGIPYLCIIKQGNRGKRDGLILIRSFLYNFNIRATRPAVIHSPYFFSVMVSFLTLGAGFTVADVLIGMDADTFFEPTCISELLKQSHYVNTVGVCGYVAVDFQSGPWSPWRVYQNAEYTISQCLRRLHQSIATHKVSCLPGCCQLLKVSETTCGDHILLDLFGYHPKVTDSLLKQIRATASEDRNHVCLMLSAFPKAQTRQALRARAYTDVPRSWSVFLSQRRRWTLGATSNDLLLVFAPGIVWFERLLACANVLTWVLNLFIIACIASFIKACTFVHYSLILAFASVMICPLIYYILIVVWQPRGVKARVQYLLGLLIYFFLGPFLNITVLLYALWSLDNFAWGKTRKVIETVQTLPGSEKMNEQRPRRGGRNKIRKSPPRSFEDSRFQNLAAEESMARAGF